MIEKLLNDLLSKLGAGSKEIVYVSVTPSVGLEVIQIDPVLRAVKAYKHKPLEYNDSMREISNYYDFKATLEEIFEELKLSPKCNIVLNMPMVHFGKIELPLLLNDESVTEAIVSEVEQAYIFKRCEPVISWFEANTASSSSETRTIFYSAIQKTAVDKIKEVLGEMGATLSGLEISLTSSLRALAYSGLTETQMAEGTSWNIMLVNSTGFSIVSMLGKNIIDYYEEPLALKTFEVEEIYEAINTSAQLALMNFPTNYLYVISDTDMVSAEHLASKLQFEGSIDFLENNSFKKREVLPTSLNILPDEVMKISLQSIGIATSKLEPYPVRLEFSGNKTEVSDGVEESISFEFHGREIMLTESVLKKISLGAAAILIVPLLILMLVIPKLQAAEKTKLDSINSEIQSIESQINELKSQTSTKGSFVVNTEVETVLRNNRAKLMTYTALGESVPKDLWITYFTVNSSGQIDIKGISEDVENVYIFFKNLKDSLVNVNIRLEKLEMLSNTLEDAVTSMGPALYEFQIVNSGAISSGNASVSAPVSEPAQKAAPQTAQQPQQPAAKGSLENLKPVKQLGGFAEPLKLD